MIERVAAALISAGLDAKAGELFELARMNTRALEAYRQGHAWRKAVELCRVAFPAEVVKQEEAWADYLVSQKQMDAAINHYIEARANDKAVEAAISSRQWHKAAQVLEVLDEETAQKYYATIAQHYHEVQDFELAEKYYVCAGNPRAAIDMHIHAGKWEDAHVLATRHMKKQDVADMYIAQAELLEGQKAYKDAEKLYLQVE